MKYGTIVGGIICGLSLTALIGCASISGQTHGVEAAHSTPANSEVVHARITLLSSDPERPVRTVELKAKEDIAHLMAYFPQCGAGLESPCNWSFAPTVKVQLVLADQRHITVVTDGMHWNEGKGDWSVGPWFNQYLLDLFTAPELVETAAAGSSVGGS